MLPRFSSNHPPESALAKTKGQGHSTSWPKSAGIILFSQLQNLFSCEPCHRVVVSTHRRPRLVTPFANHVLGVVFGRSDHQVGWINALPVVANMHDALPVRNLPVANNPREAVNIKAPTVCHEGSVAIALDIPKPFPAAICGGFVHPSPKAFIQGSPLSDCRTLPFGKWLSWRVKGCNLVLHKLVLSICATLSAASTAREHFAIMANLRSSSSVLT